MGKQRKIIYDKGQNAHYLYEVYNFNNTFTRYTVPVVVLGETEKSYYVELKQPTQTRFIGDKIWVMKKKIVFPTVHPDTSQFWYNNLESREIF